MSRPFVDGWKVFVSWAVALPQAIVLTVMGVLLVFVPIYSLVRRTLGAPPDWMGETGFFPAITRALLLVLLMAYYWLPSLLGGLYTFLCLFLHLWSWRPAMAMGSLKWLFAATFLISILYAGHFVWWHLTGQKFGYL